MVRTTEKLSRRLVCIGCLAAALVVGGWSCGGSDSSPNVDVRLFGWAAPGGGEGAFVGDLSKLPGAQEMTVKLTKPAESKIVEQKSASIGEGGLELPDLSGGEDLRLDFDLLGTEGGRSTRIGSGASPRFSPGSSDLNFRVMIAPVREFAPVGAQFAQAGGEISYGEVGFDDSAADGPLGRVGHRAAATDNGEVLVVGGGRMDADLSPGSVPNLGAVHDDVQRFDPGTGFVSDLSFDVDNNQPRPGGAGRLNTGRAFHTLTSIGDNRFLVIGGFTQSSGEREVVATIEVIDLSADPGSRVAPTAVSLSTPRARHTATFRPEANQVVVAGGVDAEGTPIDSVEIVDLSSSTVARGPSLATSRAGHSAFLLGQTGESVWLVGGRDGSSALSSTEIITAGGEVAAGAEMGRARYNFAATRLSAKVAMVCGGFTSTDGAGAPADSCQLGRAEADDWGQTYAMQNSRGGADMVDLDQSRDVVVIGGRDASGSTVLEAARLNFQGRDASKLYQVESGVGTMYKSRYQPTTTNLETGMILLTGGLGFTRSSGDGVEECRRASASNCGLSTLKSLEYYNPGDTIRASDAGGSSSALEPTTQ